MRVAISSQHWRTECVARVLQTCDIIYTTNRDRIWDLHEAFPRAQIKLRGSDMRSQRKVRKEHAKDVVIDFSEIFRFLHGRNFRRPDDGHATCKLIDIEQLVEIENSEQENEAW